MFLISAFASLVSVSVGITKSVVWLNICAITAWSKNDKSIIKKKKRKYDEIVLLRKYKLSTIEVLIFNSLIVSYIVLLNDVLRKILKLLLNIDIVDISRKLCEKMA